MNCWFCDIDLEKSRKTEDSDDHENYPVWHRYHCQTCKAHYNVMDTIGQVTDYSLRWKDFIIEFDVANSRSQIIKEIRVTKKDSHTGAEKQFSLFETVLEFDHLVNITPTNAADKVPLYILFS